MTFGREGIQIPARQVPFLRDQLRTDALRNETFRIATGNPRAEKVLAQALAAHGYPTHRLDTRGDHDVICACDDPLRGKVNGLLTAATLPIHGDRRDRLGQSGRQRRPPRGVGTLLPYLPDRATDDVIHESRIYPGAFDECANGVCV
ncbi:Uncharacterised protein [Mycobacteroides abscessus subsp. massiliense]|nr:Uncharacterised protein [Mycobacteroides abscessus subsp. massiliense]